MTTIQKPWGHETIWAHAPGKYCGKILTIGPDKRLSKQYHRVKDETMMLLFGSATLEIGDAVVQLVVEHSVAIPPNTVHRLIAGDEGCIVLEVSTDDLDDVVRIEDDYDRPAEEKLDEETWDRIRGVV